MLSEDVGIKRRRLYLIEQSLEKSCKATLPLLLNFIKTLDPDKRYKFLEKYEPKLINHYPKKFLEDLPNSLLTLNEVEEGIGKSAKMAFRKNDIFTLNKIRNKLNENIKYFYQNQNDLMINGSPGEHLELLNKFIKNVEGMYIVVLSVWMILGQYEQEFRYPSKKAVPDTLLKSADNLQEFIEEFIKYADYYIFIMKSIKFPKN